MEQAEGVPPQSAEPADGSGRPCAVLPRSPRLLFVPLLALLVDRDPTLCFQEGYWFVSKAWTWILGMAATGVAGVLCLRAVRDARAFSRPAGRLPEVDLLDPARLAPFARQALRAQVAAVPEWPLDPSTLRRYGLFLAIPLASWVGGALVERALDRALG